MITVEILYALPARHTLLTITVPVGTTVGNALQISGIADAHPELDLATAAVGIFGSIVERQREVTEGDRIEIYRPLVADPKESRHARVAKRRAGRGESRKMDA